jgi:nickel-dependent lactate racemase
VERQIPMPFGEDTVTISVPDDVVVADVEDVIPSESANHMVRNSLDFPLESDRLTRLASKGDRVVVVVPDMTRPGKFRSVVVREVIKDLHAAGVRDEDVTILNGPGSHRANTKAEFVKMMGEDLVSSYRVVNHDLYDEKNLVDLGTSDLGDPVIVNRMITEADLVVDVGLVHPQPSAGYSSGGKHFSVGVAGARTIISTHRSFDPRGIWGATSRMGVWKGNHFRDRHESIGRAVQAQTKAGVIFTVNVVINSRHDIIGAFSGEMMASFRAAAALADRQWKVHVPGQADMVICAAGHPYDKDIYQVGVAVCSLERAPVPAVREGGVIIFVGPMGEVPTKGTTEDYVANLLGNAYGPEDVFEVAREFDERGEVPPLGLQRAFSNCLFETLVHGHLFMAGARLPGAARSAHWTPSRTFEEAYQRGRDMLGRKDVSTLVVPRVRSTVVDVEQTT